MKKITILKTKNLNIALLSNIKPNVENIESSILSINQNQLSIPGIVGGKTTAVSNQTQNSYIELANFVAEKVAINSFNLGIRNETSKVFASYLPTKLDNIWLKRAIQINPSLKTNINLVTNFSAQNIKVTNSIIVDLEYLSARLDDRPFEENKAIIEEALSLLGHYNNQTNELVYNPYYQSINTQDQLFSELIRLIGFDKLKPQNLQFEANQNTEKSAYTQKNDIRNLLTTFGFDEVITRPFIEEKYLLDKKNAVELENPGSNLLPYFRDSLMPSLCKTYSLNQKKGFKSIKLFEINQICTNQNPVKLQDNLSAIWSDNDPYFGTTLVQEIAKLFISQKPIITTQLQSFGEVTNYVANNFSIKLVALSNAYKKEFDIPLTSYIWMISANLDLDKYPVLNLYKEYKDISDYPALQRSYTCKVEKQITWNDFISNLEKTISDTDFNFDFVPTERIAIDEQFDRINFKLTLQGYNSTPNKELVSALEDYLDPFILK